MNSNNERREVHYSGHVQGVGFRYTVNRIASGYPLSGFVENLSDGRVHLVVEGASRSLDRFLTEIREELSDYIAERLVDKQSATGEFNNFGIRR